MFDSEANAAAVGRVNRRIKERHRSAYNRVLESIEGRAFLMELAELCGLYEPCDTPEAEGMRRVVVHIRKEVENLGLIDKWQIAEKETADFKMEMKRMLEQTEQEEEKHEFI